MIDPVEKQREESRAEQIRRRHPLLPKLRNLNDYEPSESDQEQFRREVMDDFHKHKGRQQ